MWSSIDPIFHTYYQLILDGSNTSRFVSILFPTLSLSLCVSLNNLIFPFIQPISFFYIDVVYVAPFCMKWLSKVNHARDRSTLMINMCQIILKHTFLSVHRFYSYHTIDKHTWFFRLVTWKIVHNLPYSKPKKEGMRWLKMKVDL